MRHTIKLHRNPTAFEINSGEGAIHYKDFPTESLYKYICHKRAFATLDDARAYASRLHKRTGAVAGIELGIKFWLVCPDDGLRYYRSRY